MLLRHATFAFRTLLLVIGSALAFAPATARADSDPLIGHFAVDCMRASVECSYEISSTPEQGYALTYRVTEKGKPSNQVCQVKGTSFNKIAQELTVKTDDNNTLSVRPEKGNNVFVYASYGAACELYKMGGVAKRIHPAAAVQPATKTPKTSAAAAQRDPFIGTYWVKCPTGRQCWYDIEEQKEKPTYKVTFTVADRVGKTLSKVDGFGAVRDDGILWVMQGHGHALYITLAKEGAVKVEQARLGLCGNIHASGLAQPIGN